ncbi:hypothetical protein JCM11491_006657 [Sporobolomyces phaffii]
MTALRRPGPPLRTYTETIRADVDDATSTSVFHLSINTSPHPDPATPTPPFPVRTRRRAPTWDNSDQPRRRRSHEEIRLPPPPSGLSAQHPAPARATPSRQSSVDSYATAGSRAAIRRANSTDLLSIVDDFHHDEISDEGFSSEEEPFRFRPPSIASTTTSQHSSRQGIRIEDASNRDSNVFVKQISIPAYHAVGSEGSGFVVFDLEISTLPTASSQGTLIRAHKRYSAFVRLRADLVAAHPASRRAIPRLPPKSSLAKFRPSFLEKRRQLLAFWLSSVLLHPILGASPISRAWVLE